MSPKKNRTTAGQRAREAQAAGADAPFNKLRRAAEPGTADDDALQRAMTRDLAPATAPPLWETVMLRPWTDTTLVRIDDAYDRAQASRAGGSRFAAYVTQNAKEFEPWHGDADPVEFAVAAWHTATGPVMSPGYVRLRPDLRRITLHRDDWDGALVVRAAVPLRHHHLTGSRLWGIDDWETERGWHSDDDGGYRRLQEPDREYARQTAILTTAEIHHRAADWPLHTPAALSGPALPQEAHAALLVLVEQVNAAVGPLVEQLLAGTR